MDKPKETPEKIKAGVERVTIKGHNFVITTSTSGKRITLTDQEYEIQKNK